MSESECLRRQRMWAKHRQELAQTQKFWRFFNFFLFRFVRLFACYASLRVCLFVCFFVCYASLRVCISIAWLSAAAITTTQASKTGRVEKEKKEKLFFPEWGKEERGVRKKGERVRDKERREREIVFVDARMQYSKQASSMLYVKKSLQSAGFEKTQTVVFVVLK